MSAAEVRSREFLGSEEVHTSQSQPGSGSPVDVPEPRIVSFIKRLEFMYFVATLH